MTVPVPPGDYVLTLERLDPEETKRTAAETNEVDAGALRAWRGAADRAHRDLVRAPTLVDVENEGHAVLLYDEGARRWRPTRGPALDGDGMIDA